MLVDGTPYRTIWLGEDGESVEIIDQRKLPWSLEVATLRTSDDAAHAIFEMLVRGAGLIGATAASGMFLAALECRNAGGDKAFDKKFARLGEKLKATRPTAVNLAWAGDRQCAAVAAVSGIDEKIAGARHLAAEVADEDAEWCRRIGEHGSVCTAWILDRGHR